ncbi:SMP-30/gluconolactonase/LRE family protein [Mesorhizobium sp. 8]|uniref:SMP-30/gluconolactonase/LRE family protein n=1 Tax=Mesorhizobium sp. 8 TaxID=2584466 RepID=UPI0011247E2E|nr:SMP-30/gluconolactonase/LRE family protein [Mesorhizobium sp. 8]QDC00703.1 SMP-30/gluconolactonase/LRE family protein [Mesorhizobium sp. 8]
MKADVAVAAENILGECPIWCGRTQTLYWVDGRAPALHALDPAGGGTTRFAMPETIGSICLTEKGDLLAAMTTGVFRLSRGGVLGAMVFAREADQPDNRFNDGRCDRRGRFWVGTMNDKARIATGNLWRIGPDLAATRMAGDIIVPNSLAFSPDDRTMYLSDTYRHEIHAYDFDIDDGTLSNRRLFADLHDRPGRPDGSAIDAEGCLWNAEYAGGRVVRYRPDGRIDRAIELPVSQPSCCCFGGPALDELYITSARQRLSPQELAAQPLAGALFVVRPGVRGLPEARFAG